jgi:hypothetical protein
MAVVNVEVQPLPHLPSLRLGESSSSAGQCDDCAYATEIVFNKLSICSENELETETGIYVAIEWPEERRISGKGKTRSLVIQVKRPPAALVSPSRKAYMNGSADDLAS